MDIILYIWIGAFILFSVVEIATSASLVSIWFALASLITLIFAVFKAPLWIQLVIFIISSAVLLLCTRPVVKRIMRNTVDTNAKLDIGKTALVIEKIDNSRNKGRARINGVDWAAVSDDGSIIETGESVTVTDIQGAKLYVKK